jgi:DNA-binding GntR family transcriptional regulator
VLDNGVEQMYKVYKIIEWEFLMPDASGKVSATRLEVPNLRDTVYEAIKASILRHEYAPGAKVPEITIARSLGVSRTPVREALNRLEREGIVEVVPRYGAFVRKFGRDEILQILLIQEVLEGLAVRLAASRMSDDEVAAMEINLDNISDDASTSKILDRFMDYDIDFHGTIAAACGSPWLENLLSNIRAQMTMCRFATMHLPGRISRSVKEHLAVIQEIKSQNPERAEKAARAHISAVIADLKREKSQDAEP